MKKIINITLSVLLLLAITLNLTACGEKIIAEGLWENATYLSDTTLGEGNKTLTVEVSAGENEITLTIKTDKETVGDALLESKVVEGEDSEYGLFIKKVNGITADYNIDQSYWAFYVNGEYATSGVDSTNIDESAVYKLEYAK
ncbi:MAG: DUF4430 domain-containing protein [Acutalibacteraceae bacterium]|nr:DUF4430 domain-containing protein [Acutalibacteraceae bacterium]